MNTNNGTCVALMVHFIHDFKSRGATREQIVESFRVMLTPPCYTLQSPSEAAACRNPYKIVFADDPTKTVAQFDTRRRALHALRNYVARDEMRVIRHFGKLAND